MIIDVELEEPSESKGVKVRRGGYARKPATEFRDEPARLTTRQAAFLRNLVRIAEAIGSSELPVDFEIPGRGECYLDRGCIKIAEHSGFILPLANGPQGVVETISLNWDATGQRRSEA